MGSVPQDAHLLGQTSIDEIIYTALLELDALFSSIGIILSTLHPSGFTTATLSILSQTWHHV